jgi:hypothetical protein
MNDARFDDDPVTAINQSCFAHWYSPLMARSSPLVLSRIRTSGRKSEWRGANLVWPGNGVPVASAAESKGISLIATPYAAPGWRLGRR